MKKDLRHSYDSEAEGETNGSGSEDGVKRRSRRLGSSKGRNSLAGTLPTSCVDHAEVRSPNAEILTVTKI